MKIIAFAGSNSPHSINKKLVTYAASLFDNPDTEILDLNDYELPLFSVDREEVLGRPQLAQDFLAKIGSADLILLSLAENNGNYSAAFKNAFDWASRVRNDVFQDKPMLLMSTSPGRRGGRSVLDIAQANLPRYGGNIIAEFSLPQFYEHFDLEKGVISNQECVDALQTIVKQVKVSLGA
jgi:chromate reductase, NAD(P)H dehydrogenase (quinone)